MSILIIGDVGVDDIILGNTNRIAPESPIPITLVTDHTRSLGMAGNVAANCATIFTKTTLITAWDKTDEVGITLAKKLTSKKNINLHIYDSPNRPVTVKTRIKTGNHYIARFDIENTSPITDNTANAILEDLYKNIRQYNAIIISDYGKGLLTESLTKQIVSIANKHNIFVAIDPKGVDYSKYRGATLIKPNALEAQMYMQEQLSTENDWINYENKILDECLCTYILTTLSEKGMRIAYQDPTTNKIIRHYKQIEPSSVTDVCGCGDTIIVATIKYLYDINKLSLRNEELNSKHMLQTLTNIGSIAVTTDGCYTISQEDWDCCINTPISLSNKDKCTIFTNGCFDILHAGHIQYLHDCKKLGDTLIIGINSDDSIARLKGPQRPIMPLSERINTLKSLPFVDEVISFNEDTPIELIKKIQPNILAKGGDYKKENVVGQEYADRVQIIPYRKGYSTSTIIERILCSKQQTNKSSETSKILPIPKSECISPINSTIHTSNSDIFNYTKTSFGALRQKTYFKEPTKYNDNYVNKYNQFGLAGHCLANTRLGILIGAMGRMPKSLLDIGYGNGDFLRAAIPSTIKCFGSDISGYPLPEGAIFIKPENIVNKHFDVVCFFDSLEHFNDISIITQLDCNYVFITLPYCHSVDSSWFLDWKHRRPDEHLWHFDSNSLKEFFIRSNYEPIFINIPFEDTIRVDKRYTPNILTGLFRKNTN